MTERVVWHIVKENAAKLNLRTTFAVLVPVCATRQAARWSKFSFYWAMFQCKRRKRTSDASSACAAH